MPGQFQTWLTCQVCGRAAPRDNAKGWLDQEHRTRNGVFVQRCPQHWSEWALRHTKAGRTKEMRARMRKALAMPEPPMPVYLDPYPTRERERGRSGQ